MLGEDGRLGITCHSDQRSQGSSFSSIVCVLPLSLVIKLHAVLCLVSGAKRKAVQVLAGFSYGGYQIPGVAEKRNSPNCSQAMGRNGGCCLETGSHCVAQAGLDLAVLGLHS
jgi:hypothetical protein